MIGAATSSSSSSSNRSSGSAARTCWASGTVSGIASSRPNSLDAGLSLSGTTLDAGTGAGTTGPVPTRFDRPRRCTLPMTALRVTLPSSLAIWLADCPSPHIFFSVSTRSSVQDMGLPPTVRKSGLSLHAGSAGRKKAVGKRIACGCRATVAVTAQRAQDQGEGITNRHERLGKLHNYPGQPWPGFPTWG